jgi:hypothetical protein
MKSYLYIFITFIQVTNDMINGTMNTFQKVWKLVGEAADALKEKNNPKLTEKEVSELQKLREEYYRTRNYQLSTVRVILNNKLFRIINLYLFFIC